MAFSVRKNTSYYNKGTATDGVGGSVSGNNADYYHGAGTQGGGSNFNKAKNTSYFPKTSSASDSGGSVSGTSAPSGSLGKSIGYVNDDPVGSNTSAARPFGGFGMGSGSYSGKDAGGGGPVNTQAGRGFRPRFYG